MQPVTIPLQLYSAGTRTTVIDGGSARDIVGIWARVSREPDWPGQGVPNLITVACEWSPNGSIWQQVGSVPVAGGIVNQSSLSGGGPALFSGVRFYFAANGRARINVTNTLSLRTAITYQLLEAADL